jgi:hypothetical protein
MLDAGFAVGRVHIIHSSSLTIDKTHCVAAAQCNTQLLADDNVIIMGAPYFYTKLNAALGGNISIGALCEEPHTRAHT